MPEIGILFDIDDLGGGMYGSEAFKIFYKNLNPNEMSNFSIYDGDTNSTLMGNDRLYCIAVKSMDSSTIDYVEKIMSEADDKGLAPLSNRFIKGNVTSAEPLVYSADVTNAIITIKAGGPTSWGLQDYEDKWTGKIKEVKNEEISNDIFCQKCGNKNPSNAKFCQKCGDSLKNQSKPQKSVPEVKSQNNNEPEKYESHKWAIILGYVFCIISSAWGILFAAYLQTRKNPDAIKHGRIQACIWAVWMIILGFMWNSIFIFIGIITLILMIYYLARDR